MGSKRIFIDVREPFEFASGHVEDAINIPLTNIVSDVSVIRDLDRESEIIVYCRTGSRSNTAIQMLTQLGFTNLINGINAEGVEKHYLRNSP